MLAEAVYYLKRPYHLVKTGLLRGLPAEFRYHFPGRKLKIICITGTDGKTTSSTLLYFVLKAAGKKVALLSTVAAYIGDEEIDTGFHVTTPDPAQIQAFMRKMVDEGYEYLVLEATSHGIYQYRLWGVHPILVGVTNITPEHLDYHPTFDLYLEAKAELVTQAQRAVINADDELSFAKLKRIIKASHTEISTYSASEELPKKVMAAITKRFREPYNQMNARLVYCLASLLKVDDAAFVAAIEKFAGVPGRMEVVGEKGGVKVIVDFAHTANGLEQALQTLRKEVKERARPGRLIAVYGCAGLRDWRKRPRMGRAGAHLADLAIFTSEDPRTEDVWSIIRQMKSDLGSDYAKILSIPDRRQAIATAIQTLAKTGDIVAIFGKGHEKSMCFGTHEEPWSDRDVAQEILGSMGAS